MSELLPWSEKAELCTFKSQLDRVSEGLLYGSFERKSLRLRYFSADGFFIVEDIQKSKPFVQIYVFEKDDEVIDSFLYICSLYIESIFLATNVQKSRVEAWTFATTL